ncbi:hypothetical protein [Caldicellulosiruptor sp. DIB 104C]|uniref:hypothetical protein n=1 Tax=Caldicellulosiruptor sp. DIB 104C TaxID=3019889 RepID=UPI0023054DEF|nr:hypothetical protein [Caldicellulosiruptor sp. DIB 104C]
MSTPSFMFLEYKLKLLSLPKRDIKEFEEQFIVFIQIFCEVLLPEMEDYFPNSALNNTYWSNIYYDWSEIERLENNVYRVKLAFAHDFTLSKRGKKKFAEECKDFVRRLNKFFEIFEFDVRFEDEPFNIEYYDPDSEENDDEDLFLYDDDDDLFG